MTPDQTIQLTLARYIHAIDDQDVESTVALFAKDGRFLSRATDSTGHDALRHFLRGLWETGPSNRRTKHIHGSTVITVRETTAECVSDLLILHRNDSAWTVGATNRHYDRLTLAESGEWLFAEKRVSDVITFAATDTHTKS